MPVAKGVEVYVADAERVLARGYRYEQEELEAARYERLPAILLDEPGRVNLAEIYGDLKLTEFGSGNILLLPFRLPGSC